LGLLRQSLHLQSRRAEPAGAVGMRLAQRLEGAQALGGARLGLLGGAARLLGEQSRRAQRAIEILELLLASEQSLLLAVGRIELHRGAAHGMPRRHDEPAAR